MFYNPKYNKYISRKHKGRILIPYTGNRGGYPTISLGGYIRCEVHVIIAWTFCNKLEGMNVVNHLNFNRKDNRACNLEWTNTSGNLKHSNINSNFCKGEKHQNAKITNDQAYEIKLWLAHRDELMKEKGNQRNFIWLSYSMIGKAYGISRSVIYAIRKRGGWSHV